MEMKEILSVFQFDWASAPGMGDLNPEKLRNKTLLISGHEPALCLAYTVLNLNDKLKLNAKVILTSPDEGFDKSVHPGVLERDDFIYTHTGHIDDIKQKIDIVVIWGLCGCKIQGTLTELKKETSALRALMKLACEKKAQKVVLFSDSRVYGKGSNKFRAFSEMEMGRAGIDDYNTQLLRTLENNFSSMADKYELSSLILRTGVILGADSNVYNNLDRLFEAVARGEEATIYITENKVSFVYISDVFNALFFALENNLGGVYNTAGGDCSVSTGALCATLRDLFGGRVKIRGSENGGFQGAELNCGKIEFAGFKPEITLQTALELCVLSYTDAEDELKFPYEHQGRLSAIQQILMGYLLEVDRICKKHNIKWYLGGGTLLGAARHKGFIPWDDDVDIMMLREDYDRFLEVAPHELPEGMILQDPKKDKTCNYCYAKLRLTDTVFATDFSKNHKDMNNGFAFDIFCHDKTANSKLGQKIHSQLTLFWLAMVFNKWNNRRVYNGKKVQSAICNFLKNIFPLRFSMRMLLFTLELFKHKRNAEFLYDGMGKSVAKGGFDKSFLDDEIKLDFMGYKMPAPAKYKEYLTNHYGDYMELAPLSTRLQGHEITLCDLNKYADFKISNGN